MEMMCKNEDNNENEEGYDNHNDETQFPGLQFLLLTTNPNFPHWTLTLFPDMLALDGLHCNRTIFVFASLVQCDSLGSLRIDKKQVHAQFVLLPFLDDECGFLDC
ncbi:hypothetical protein LguiA_013525 [Lonicera macranthoides]